MTKNCQKPKQIKFYYKTVDSKMEPTPTEQGTVWNGWAPCFDPDTDEKIGYITFYYIQQDKYINKDTPDGYFNHLKIFFVFDQFQKSSTAKVYDFVTEIDFTAATLNQRLPVGVYSSAINSTSLKITSNSTVKAEIRPDLTRYWTLNIDWKNKH